MKMNKKELPPKVDLPMLEEGAEEERFSPTAHHRRYERLYKMYLITVSVTVLLCLAVVGVLLVGLTDSGDPLGAFALILSHFDLMDLSNKNAAGDENGNQNGSQGEADQKPSVDQSDRDSHETDKGGTQTDGNGKPTLTLQSVYAFDYEAVPKGEIPILPMDLSLVSYGAGYINNSTGLTPDTEALLRAKLTCTLPTGQDTPSVLILHTHGTEGYSADGAISYVDNGSEIARTEDPLQSTVAVGKTLSDELNRLGISTVHCTTMHDAKGYSSAYARAEETVRQYLARYPSIRLVIDLHRDSVMKSSGELVRPVTVVNGEAVAQVMCVVGSSWGGEENPNWEGNLALSLQLRERLNASYGNVCRPSYLRPSTYNQEIAPSSLLLEIGASGNSLFEAERAAILVADAIFQLLVK